MNQQVLDKAVAIATKSVMNGNPVSRIVWIPPVVASSDPLGCFLVEYAGIISASQKMPWDCA